VPIPKSEDAVTRRCREAALKRTQLAEESAQNTVSNMMRVLSVLIKWRVVYGIIRNLAFITNPLEIFHNSFERPPNIGKARCPHKKSTSAAILG
jgi:hypothetical protein